MNTKTDALPPPILSSSQNRISRNKKYSVSLALGAYAIALILLFLPALFVCLQAFGDGIGAFFSNISQPEAVSAIQLTLAVTMISILINSFFGIMGAWCLTKFEFFGKKILIALIDIPLATSPVIAGMVWLLVFGEKGWFGKALAQIGVHIIYTPYGVLLATLFVTFPFVARTLLPIMQTTQRDMEESALLLGAGFTTILFKVTLPQAGSALLSGVLLTTARALGEFGAVVVVSGHIPGFTETVPLQIETLYNSYETTAAFSLAIVLVVLSLGIVLLRRFSQQGQSYQGNLP
ncbi:sulfate ABC transporter permease [Entomobacter blattae]|uniref:Sulfate transport system permease protein CysW n=1 Tax=Entomobacter blattae TaxID=2762277 RepID=A0A7H1NTV7_9PROT|nr:sulfate ABC transporter permease subunit [Entomobacter blattae]QNT79217.1 Sulfate transport system permease protein CysW [Entomobacter blattae]